MKNTVCQLLIFTGLVACFQFGASRSLAQSIQINLEQQSNSSGEIEYRVEVFGFGAGQILSPGGTAFGFGSDLEVSVPVGSLEEAKLLLEGEWTVNSFGSSEASSFTLSPIDLGSLFTDVPTIVSPANGETVGESFLLQWAYESGVSPPSGRLVSRTGGFDQADFDVDFGPPGTTEAIINIAHAPGVDAVTFAYRAGTFFDLSDLISFAEPIDPNLPFGFDVEFRFGNRSAPVELTSVRVPEPASLMLGIASLGLAMLAKGRRR